ncbi:hypothetical protein [Sporosarcina limicola]|uniref:Uncharacterized protein n=1 Tax=Sporosarcina limicola TaxID=34101 RepID=A0A927RF21_9BACL|nr:hypothetical protein [Sporosarcina limicola]MBE1556860.1 hypothetical protein [Sporosarcina limicola]
MGGNFTHLDDVPELVDNQKALTANTVEELFEMAYYEQDEENLELELRMDNFIIPSFFKGDDSKYRVCK